jgi:glycosyltransferase involved in cell wall biosynthesis
VHLDDGVNAMRIDVAICTWNRSELLAQTLEHLRSLRVPPGVTWGVVVVDNRSTDATAEVAHRFAHLLPLKYVFEERAGLNNARNRAIAETDGDVLIFTDDDVIVDAGWLEAAVAALTRHPDIAVFGGRIEPLFPVVPEPVLLEAFPELAMGFCSLNHGPIERLLGPGEHVFGANFGVRRQAIADLTFDERFGTQGNRPGLWDETEFIDRIRQRGGTVLWIPEMRLQHVVAPERATRSYLARYIQSKGCDAVRTGSRRYPGTMVFGAPRWLWRELVAARTLYVLCRATPLRVRMPVHPRSRHTSRGPWSRELATLLWLRESQYLRGAIEGYRALSPEARLE